MPQNSNFIFRCQNSQQDAFVATSMAPVAFLHPQGQSRDTATPRSLWNVAKAPKSRNLPLGSSAPGAVSRLSVCRFGPDFEPPAPWGQLEVFLPLTTQTYDPPPAPVLPLPGGVVASGSSLVLPRAAADTRWQHSSLHSTRGRSSRNARAP